MSSDVQVTTGVRGLFPTRQPHANSGVGKTATRRPDEIRDIEAGTSLKDWLASLRPRPLDQYSQHFEQRGWSNPFAVGLCTEEDIAQLSIWPEDAEYLCRCHMIAPRRLVSQWTPFIALLAVKVPLEQWLANLPVPGVAAVCARLRRGGFDSVTAIRHGRVSDFLELGIPDGTAAVLHHCALHGYFNQPLPDPNLPLVDWLAVLDPPLEQYLRAFELRGMHQVVDVVFLTPPPSRLPSIPREAAIPADESSGSSPKAEQPTSPSRSVVVPPRQERPLSWWDEGADAAKACAVAHGGGGVPFMPVGHRRTMQYYSSLLRTYYCDIIK